MNVIVSNKYRQLLSGLDIDVIKSVNGEFEVDELISMFSNFFFNKMVLDITAIKNYRDLRNIQKLSINIDMNKVILLLDNDQESASASYLSRLISMGIYNFTKNLEGIKYLYNNPNSYKDVAHLHQLEPVNDVPQQKSNIGPVVTPSVSMAPTRRMIIGFKSVTPKAGATTLIYRLKKQLEVSYTVAAIEVDKNDFIFFRDKDMISTTSQDLDNTIAMHSDKMAILIDLNKADSAYCTDIIYLIEPSILQLNKLVSRDKNILVNLRGQKIVLNKSVIPPSDITDFEYESGVKVFFNMPPMNERIYSKAADALLARLGFSKIDPNGSKLGKIFKI